MKTRVRFLAAFICMTSFTRCAPAEESSVPFEASDSAGVRIVHSREPRWSEGENWSISPTPLQTIGALTGPEEYQFVAVSSAARRSNGTLVVADAGARSVRLYDGEGTFLKTLGGPGSGPGEFRDPGPVFVTRGDSVVVWDQSLFRITRFDPQGGLAGVRTVDLGTIANAVEPPLFPGTLEPLRDGGLLVRLIEKRKDLPTGIFRQPSGALRVSEDLSKTDTLMFFGDLEQISVEAPFGRWPIPAPLGRRSWITHQGSPSRICIGDQEAPQIVCFGPGGSRTFLRWSRERTPVTKEEVAEWRGEMVRLHGQKMSEDEVLRMLDQVPVPAVRPDYSRITLDRLGNLWVEVGPAAQGTAPGVDHLVFDPEGALLGVVHVPPIQILEIGEDYVLGVHHDEFEVEYLQLFEIRR